MRNANNDIPKVIIIVKMPRIKDLRLLIPSSPTIPDRKVIEEMPNTIFSGCICRKLVI